MKSLYKKQFFFIFLETHGANDKILETMFKKH